MKTSKDLIQMFGKGSDYFRITEKQFNWLINIARNEEIIVADFIDTYYISINGKKYRIYKTYIPMACYGGGIGRKKPSKAYNVEPVIN